MSIGISEGKCEGHPVRKEVEFKPENSNGMCPVEGFANRGCLLF